MGACSSSSKTNDDDPADAVSDDQAQAAEREEKVNKSWPPKLEPPVVGPSEHLLWLNAMMAQVWPEMDELAKMMVEERIEPLIQQKMPERLKGTHFSKFTLGKKPPVFHSVEVYNLPHGTCAVHVACTYKSDMHVEVSTGALSFGMKNFGMQGELVFLLRPFIDEQPGTGGMTVYFVDPPSIYLDFTGVAGIADLFGIKGIVRAAVDDALADKLVLPHSITQLMGYKDLRLYPMVFSSPQPMGTLRVTLQKAQGLPKGDWSIFGGGTDDNYLRLAVGSVTAQVRVTEVGVEQEFMVFDPEQRLFIDLWDEDQYTDDDHLGTTDPLHLFQATAISEQPLNLRDPADPKKGAGQIWLKIEYLHGELTKLGSAGSIIMVLIREILMPGIVNDEKLVVEGTHGKVQKVSPIGKVMRSKPQDLAVDSVLADVKERLKKEGVKAATIDKVTQVEGLTIKETTRVACNYCMMFNIRSGSELDSGEIQLRLIDRKLSLANKKSAKSGDHSKDIELGKCTLNLRDLKKEKDLTLPGPVTFVGGKDLKIQAEISVSVCGLEPGPAPIVDVRNVMPPFKTS